VALTREGRSIVAISLALGLSDGTVGTIRARLRAEGRLPAYLPGQLTPYCVQVIAASRAGRPLAEIAAEHGRTVHQISNSLSAWRRAGHAIPLLGGKQRWSQAQRELLCQGAQEEWTRARFMDRLGLPWARVREGLRRWDLTPLAWSIADDARQVWECARDRRLRSLPDLAAALGWSLSRTALAYRRIPQRPPFSPQTRLRALSRTILTREASRRAYQRADGRSAKGGRSADGGAADGKRAPT
jgi:transposase